MDTTTANAVEQLQISKRQEYQRNRERYRQCSKSWRLRNIEKVKAYLKSPAFKLRKNAARRLKYKLDPVYRQAQADSKKLRAKRTNELQTERRKRMPYWKLRYENALKKANLNSAEIINKPALKEHYHQIFTQTGMACNYCHNFFPIHEIVLDHKQPYALGGCHAVHNLGVSCYACNSHKHATSYKKWVAKLETN